jgi:hypothetical protein
MISSLGDSLLPALDASVAAPAYEPEPMVAPAPSGPITAGGRLRAPAALATVTPRISLSASAAPPAKVTGDYDDEDADEDEDVVEEEEAPQESFRAQFFGGGADQENDYDDDYDLY